MKPSKSHRNLPPGRERVTKQRQPRASMPARQAGAGGKAADRAGPNRVQASPPGKKFHMSINTMRRERRKAIRAIAFAAIESSRPIAIWETTILSVLRGVPIQCRETELRRELCYLEDKGIIRLDRVDGAPWMARIVGPATGFAAGDPHIAARTVDEAPHGARPHPAGKVARADSRRPKRVSG